MAIDSKASLSNPNGFDLTDEACDQSNINIHSIGSNFRSTAGVVNGLTNSASLTPPSGPLPPALSASNGQLALVNEIRPPYLGLPRVHVQTRLDCLPSYHPGLTEISITEVKTTRFLTPTSVAGRLFQPSGIRSIRSYDDVYRVSNATANRLMMALATRDNDCPYNSMGSVPQTQSIIPGSSNAQLQHNLQQFLNPVPHILDSPSFTGQELIPRFDLNEMPPMDDQSLPPNKVLNPEPAGIYDPNDPRDKKIPSNNEQQKPDEAPKGGRPRTGVHAHSSRMNGEPRQPGGGVDESDHNVGGHDGRTHSLPCRKYGPYKCPWHRCRCVFPTSQQFAAHTLLHYARETPVQRKRRRMARSRHVRLLGRHYLAHGFSVWPREAVRQRRRREAAERNTSVKIEAEESGDENELEMQLVVHDDAASSTAVGEPSRGVKIKQAPEEPEFSSSN